MKAGAINSLCQATTIGLFYKLVYYSIRKCSYAWPLFELSLVSFSPLNTYIARYARVRRTEIYCAIARKLSHPTPNRVPSSLLEWPRCEGGRLVKLIYRTSLELFRIIHGCLGVPTYIHRKFPLRKSKNIGLL